MEVKLVGRLKDLDKHLQTRVASEPLEIGYAELEVMLDGSQQSLIPLKNQKNISTENLSIFGSYQAEKVDVELINKPVSQLIGNWED